MTTDRDPGRIKLFEDELDDDERSVMGFVKREKQIVFVVVAFVLSSLVMRCASNQLDQAVANEKAAKIEGTAKRNPWSKDQ